MNKMSLEVGQMAPDFEAKIETGASIKLSDYRGKKVILYFYPKDATPGCTAQACNLRDNYEQLLNAGYVIFGVSSDTEKSHQKFIEKQNLPFSLLADTEKTVANLYQVWGKKKFMGREYEGVFRTTFVIDASGMITHTIDKVDTKDAAKQLFEILEA
jgi:peroxiredoxin Q/BCP